MIWLYRLLFLPLFAVMMPYYACRMLKRGGYGKDFKHRLGFHKNLPKSQKKRIWLQAVSVGESEAIANLVELITKSGDFELVITTTTSTGYKIIKDKYDSKCLYTGIFPWDFCVFSWLSFNRIKPDICVLTESELWPEHLYRANKRGIDVVLINARMSDRSFKRYKKLGTLPKRLFAKITHILSSGKQESDRLLALGVEPNKLETVGNIKFDTNSAINLSDDDKAKLRKEMGFSEDSLVLLASSTWEGEEEMLVETLGLIRKAGINANLLIIPRHEERRKSIEAMLKKQPYSFNFRKANKQASSPCDIYVADTTGEMSKLSQVADIAFIGKSLEPNVGGQTPIEPANLALAFVHGNNMTNFKAACQSLEEHKACLKAKDKEEAIKLLVDLAKDPQLRQDLGSKAKAWHSQNQGASQKIFDYLKSI